MDDKKLEEMYQLVRENNAMLRSQRRSAFLHSVVTVVWWVLLLVVLPALSWLYLKPYYDAVSTQYETVQKKGTQLQNQARDLETQIGGFTELLKEFGIGGN